jgi:predicted ATPase
MQGHIEEGLAVMREGLAAWRATGSKFHVPYRLARAAEAYLVAGEIEEGLRLICEATDQSGDCWFAPELHRLKGELLLEAGRRDEVEGCLEQALKAAQEQGARLCCKLRADAMRPEICLHLFVLGSLRASILRISSKQRLCSTRLIKKGLIRT